MAFDVDYFTLSGTDATNKYVTLTYPPTSPVNVAMDIISGTAQHLFGVPAGDTTGDFFVSGSTIRWDATNYGLYNSFNTGDRIRIIYDRS